MSPSADPRWSILIATQPSRSEYLKRLLGVLTPQAAGRSDVEVMVRTSDPELGLGDNRQIMREGARGLYSNFVDDDDLVASDYVGRVLPLLDGVDYVSYEFQEYSDGMPRPPTHVSLHHGPWHQDSTGLWRDIVHFCPVKTALALAVPMSGGWGEDTRWTNQMRDLGIIKTEHHIDAAIHFLYYRSSKKDGAKASAPYHQKSAAQVLVASQEGQGYATSGVLVGTGEACLSCGSRGMLVPSNGRLHCNQCGANF
jgi:hypothetical protein